MKLLFSILLLFAICFQVTFAANKVWTCITPQGAPVFTFEALNVFEFKNGRAKVYKNYYVNNNWIRGYGFVDATGKTIIECTLEKAKDFDATVTWVKYKDDDFYKLIDLNGNPVVTKQYKKVGQFYNLQKDICPVFDGHAMGFINTKGQEIIPCKFIGGAIFQYNLLSVALANESSSLYGFINKKGEKMIPLQYKQAGSSSFEDGLARVQLNGSTVLIDTLGNVIFKTKKGTIQGYNDGLVLVFINKTERTGYGWLNLKNEFVIEPIYDHAENFNSDGFAVVTLNKKKGLISKTGQILLDLKYQDIYANYSRDGYIMGTYPSAEPAPLSKIRKNYFNKKLEPISLPNIIYLSSKKSGKLIPFKDKNQLYGYLRQDYNVVIAPVYKKVKSFSENLAWVIAN
ncbi:MAG: WG repeat-containing protein [Crocinitomicaceae bacterium]